MACLAVACLTTHARAQDAFLIRDVRLFDGERTSEHRSVVVVGNRIARVGDSSLAADAPTVIDGRGKTLLPGLIDAHVHSGPIPTLTTASEAEAFVSARVAEGSDYIKIIRDDLHQLIGKSVPTLDSATIAALVQAAHAHGKLAVVHVGSEADARIAIGAGADGLAHLFSGESASADFGTFASSHHVFVIPTLETLYATCGRADGAAILADEHLAPFIDAQWRTRLLMKWPLKPTSCVGTDEALRQLAAAHVPILAGTDSPVPGTMYGASLLGELRLLVQAGLTPEAALRAATSATARAFHLDDRGSIAAGKRADLLLVEGDPTHDILATRQIVAVWKTGVLFTRVKP
jgi:imidazolonepropionase-like amidohydrolase